MKKRYIIGIFVLILLVIIILPQTDKPKTTLNKSIPDTVTNNFSNEQIVTINGFEGNAMEPYISRDEKYLFFNSEADDNGKDLYYAEKINDLTFEFKGEVQGVNTPAVDGNPTMDSSNNFYYITTEYINLNEFSEIGVKTIYSGIFDNGTITDLKQVNGTINIEKGYWLPMGVEITNDGNTMYISSAKFEAGATVPSEGNIRLAIKEGDEFNIPENEAKILKNINTEDSIEYAGEVSDNELEIFYSRLILNPPQFKLYRAERNSTSEPFGNPIEITEPFKEDNNAFVEGPTLSSDGKRLYYHKLENEKFSIFMLSRN